MKLDATMRDPEYNLMRRLEDWASNTRLWEDDIRHLNDLRAAVNFMRRMWDSQKGYLVRDDPPESDQKRHKSEDSESVEDYPTVQAYDILTRLMPEWRALFLAKNAGYKKVDNRLGPKGVFPDVNRKVGRLERDIWDGEPEPDAAESTREVILDLIGHLFLMLHMLDSEERGTVWREGLLSNMQGAVPVTPDFLGPTLAAPYGYPKSRQTIVTLKPTDLSIRLGRASAGAEPIIKDSYFTQSPDPADNIPGTGEAAGDPSEEDGDPPVESEEDDDATSVVQDESEEDHDDDDEEDEEDGDPAEARAAACDWDRGYAAGVRVGSQKVVGEFAAPHGGWSALPDEIQQALRHMAEGGVPLSPSAAAAVREFIPDGEGF